MSNGATRYPKTSLQDTETRIRRLYGTPGELGVGFTPDMTPVVIAGDLLSPGTSDFRGRRFMWTVTKPGTVYGAANTWNMKVTAATVVEGVTIGGKAAAAGRSLDVRVMDPVDAALASVYGAQKAYWIERPASTFNYAPAITDDALGVPLVAVGWNVFSMNLETTMTSYGYVPLGAYLEALGGIGFTLSGAATLACSVTFHCHVF